MENFALWYWNFPYNLIIPKILWLKYSITRTTYWCSLQKIAYVVCHPCLETQVYREMRENAFLHFRPLFWTIVRTGLERNAITVIFEQHWTPIKSNGSEYTTPYIVFLTKAKKRRRKVQYYRVPSMSTRYRRFSEDAFTQTFCELITSVGQHVRATLYISVPVHEARRSMSLNCTWYSYRLHRGHPLLR